MLIPLRLGPPEYFRTVREFLKDSGYTEQVACERLGLGALHEVLARPPSERPCEAGDVVGLLVRLLLAGAPVDEKLLRARFPAPVVEALVALGLVESHGQGMCYAPVLLYPMQGLHIASDRWTNPDGSRFIPQADIVYPALTRNTYRFLGMLPADPCRSVLELCSGTGMAALAAASSYAGHSWAVDIAVRSVRFGEFNRLLNGVDNATMLLGDLYEPVRGLQFDRIVAHPPYVPSSDTKWIFQDAGASGEEITRRIVAGLPRHLAPGGRLYCLSLGADHEGEPFETRIRGWLGERESEFDIMVFVLNEHTPQQVASQPLLQGGIDRQEYKARLETFETAGVSAFVYGLFVVQNKEGSARPEFTARRRLGPRTARAEFEWALGWEAAASELGASFLLAAKPVLSKNLEMRVLHRMAQGALEPAEFHLQTDYPFSMECHVHPWTVALLETCDGRKTGAELFDWCRQSGWIASGVPQEDFSQFLGRLVSGGFLELDGFKPPGADSRT